MNNECIECGVDDEHLIPCEKCDDTLCIDCWMQHNCIDDSDSEEFDEDLLGLFGG